MAVLGTVALILVYSAYVAEVFRAGIESVHPSQQAAARSLGLTHRRSMRLVILPQAVRRVLPPLLNDFVALQKDVGLISVLGASTCWRRSTTARCSSTASTSPTRARTWPPRSAGWRSCSRRSTCSRT